MRFERHIPRGNLILAENLHCKDLAIAPLFNHVDFAETASSYNFHDEEVVLRNFIVWLIRCASTTILALLSVQWNVLCKQELAARKKNFLSFLFVKLLIPFEASI